MQLDWSSSVPASALWGALAQARGRSLIEPKVDAALRPIVDGLLVDCQTFGCQAEPLLRQLVGYVADGISEKELAKAGLSKIVGRDHDVRFESSLARAIGQLIAALIAARPHVADELSLRVDPLRGQWEARGPGLLAEMGRLLPAELFVPAASVVLVHPMLGGGGEAHPQRNRVTFEGLLANPVARLPEVLRLGWLLGRLNFDLPAIQDPIGQRLDIVGSLALIPIVLAAAEKVELARADEEHLRLALDTWAGMPQAAAVLGSWWETYQASRASWPAAVLALGALLADV